MALLGHGRLAVHQVDRLRLPMIALGAAMETDFFFNAFNVGRRERRDLSEVENADAMQLLGDAGADAMDPF